MALPTSKVYTDSAGQVREGEPNGGSGGADTATIIEALDTALADNTGQGSLSLSTVDNAIVVPIKNGEGVLGIDIAGLTGSGATVVCEMRLGDRWRTSVMLVNGTGGASTTSLNEDATFRSNASARTAARIRVTQAGTGSATVSWSLSTNSSLVQLVAPLPPGANRVGTMGVDNFPASFNIGNLPATQAVSGTVGVSNFPSAFQVSNFPATQQVSGTVTASISGTVPVTQSGSWAVAQSGAWTTQSVQSGNWSVTVAGTVAVSNFPATQAVSGTLGAIQAPTGLAASAIVPTVYRGVNSFVAKNSAGNLYGASAVAAPVDGACLMILLNRTTAPATNSTITASEVLAVVPLAAGGAGSVTPAEVPDRFTAGIVGIFSTSSTTFTPPAALPIFVRVRFV